MSNNSNLQALEICFISFSISFAFSLSLSLSILILWENNFDYLKNSIKNNMNQYWLLVHTSREEEKLDVDIIRGKKSVKTFSTWKCLMIERTLKLWSRYFLGAFEIFRNIKISSPKITIHLRQMLMSFSTFTSTFKLNYSFECDEWMSMLATFWCFEMAIDFPDEERDNARTTDRLTSVEWNVK